MRSPRSVATFEKLLRKRNTEDEKYKPCRSYITEEEECPNVGGEQGEDEAGNGSEDGSSSDMEGSYESSGIDSEEEKNQAYLDYLSNLRMAASRRETRRLKEVLKKTERTLKAR